VARNESRAWQAKRYPARRRAARSERTRTRLFKDAIVHMRDTEENAEGKYYRCCRAERPYRLAEQALTAGTQKGYTLKYYAVRDIIQHRRRTVNGGATAARLRIGGR